MEVARCGISRQELPSLLTQCVKAIGRDLNDAPRNQVIKERISHINQIAVLDWERGIFTIAFNAGGNPRYHRLSKQRNEELQAQDHYVQGVVSRISREIVDQLGLFQEAAILPLDASKKLRQKFETPDASLQEMLDKCRFVENYCCTRGNDQLSVFVMRERGHFDINPILAHILTPQEYNRHINHQLLDQLLLSSTLSFVPENPPQVEIIMPPLVQGIWDRICERYQDLSTGMAQQAKEYFQKFQQAQSPNTDGTVRAVAAKAFLTYLANGSTF